MSDSAGNGMDYLFESEEFESDSFHAPKFVAKYRRVSSLDSLKEQLRNYSENLKHQLFVIINRDYRDFIGIATKLDGVDTRVEMLRRPLLDLRMNMSSLHDWLLSCLNIIEKKVNLRTSIKRQKMIVQCALSCLNKLDLAESILDININPSATASSDSHAHDSSDTRALTAADTPMKKRSNTATSAGELDNDNNNDGDKNQNKITNKNGAVILRTDMLNRLHRLRKRSSTSTNRSYSANVNGGLAYPSLDLFYASELERAAFILAESVDELDTIRSSLESTDSNTNASSLSSSKPNDKKGDAPMSHVASSSNNASTYRVLLDRHERLCNRLVTRIQSWLEEMIVDEVDSEVSNVTDLDKQMEALQSRTHTHKNRCIVHCLRALVVLGKGEVAETVVAQTLQSHIDAVLTVGRLDGNGGRGTYSGLKETLCGLLSKVSAQMRNILFLAELPTVKSCGRHSTRITESGTTPNNTHNNDDKDNSAMDLLVGGVWHPITKTLVEKFPSVLSTGIASILAKCFTAMQSFHEDFSKVLGEGYASQIYDRLQRDRRYKALQEKWKLDLYFQLRSGELCTRLDMACQRASTEGWMVSVAAYLYNNSSTSNTDTARTSVDEKGGSKMPAGSKKKEMIGNDNNAQPSTLTMQEVQDYLAALSLKQTFSMNIPLLEVFALEMAVPFHDTVYFKQLGGKMLSLSLRTLKRLEAHIVILTNIATTNFPQGAAAFTDHTLDSLGGRISLAIVTTEKEEVPMTPAKMPLTPERTPGTIPQTRTPGSAGRLDVIEDSSAEVSSSIEELGLILIDINTLKQWAQSIWAPLVHAKLQRVLTDTCNNAVNKLDDISTALWSKSTKMLISACKDNLKGVKGITSRYRMTNKPAPSSASDYVDTILNPLRDFLSRYEAQLANFFPRGVWDVQIIQEVNNSFTFYLKSVIETVKNMDSTLQRRARNTQKGGVSDSEKIMMQLKLDVEAYKSSISALNIDLGKVDNVSMLDASLATSE